MIRALLCVLTAALAPLLLHGEPPKAHVNRNIPFGMPGAAKADPEHKDAYLIERPQYVLSYNDKRKTPNWVCWQLVKKDIGKVARGAFEPDPDLPKGFHRVEAHAYTGSGFDRGHMCPSRDRSDNEKDNDATFLMTNVVPQAPACNQKGWEKFERYCREQAEHGKELYIAAGPHGIGGTGTDGKKLTVGKKEPFVTVPAHVWKVVLVLDRGTNPAKTSRTIAVWMPNDETVTDDWASYRVSVAEVEKKTGLKFFPLVPEDVAAAIKEKPDAVKIHEPKK
jgi:endonuclease G